MRFIVSSTVLLKSLQSVSGIISSNNSLPILDNFLFELKEDHLRVTASDLETTMSVNIQLSNIEEPDSMAIPAKLLLDTLKTFSDIPLTFTIDVKTFGVEISAGEGKYRLSGASPTEFPKVPRIESVGKAEMPASVLTTAINKTLFATGNDDLRPMMSGVYCQLSPEGTTFVATDAHKLVKYTRKDVKVEEEATLILPKKPLNQLKNTMGFSEDMVIMEYNQTNAFFKFSNVELVCRLIEGRYPNYEAVIPRENPNKLVVDRSLILGSMRRVALFANQSTHQVRFRITGQEMYLSAEDIEYANQANERLACQYTGEDIEIGFNSKFILEMLNNMDGESISLELSVPNRPGLLVPADNENANEDLLMLVMPVMLNT
jgi:DNA polymerase III subunit beta